MPTILWEATKLDKFLNATSKESVAKAKDAALKCSQTAHGISFTSKGGTVGWIKISPKILNDIFHGKILPDQSLVDEVKNIVNLLCIEDAQIAADDNPVPLRHATALMQPVKGTSENSVYHAVAISDTLNVAARWIGNSLSIRVEGDLAAHVDDLKEAGFLTTKSSKHASMHLGSVGSELLMRKALGSVITALDIDFKETLSKLSNIVGVGKQ